jgi:hypothetical protein
LGTSAAAGNPSADTDRQPARAKPTNQHAAPAAPAIPAGRGSPGEIGLYNDAQMSDDQDAARRMFELIEAICPPNEPVHPGEMVRRRVLSPRMGHRF